MVRARMQCTMALNNGTTADPPTQEQVGLHAVYSGDPDDPNYTWSQATPSGGLNLFITNPSAMGKFEVGKVYYVDVVPAEE